MSNQPHDSRSVLLLAALTTSRRIRLLFAFALFLGWLGWLSYAALSKSHAPVVSRAQAAATTHPVIADVKEGTDGKPSQFVTVVEPLTGNGPVATSDLFVRNMSTVSGYTGPGKYLLMLTPDPDVGIARNNGPTLTPYVVVGQQRSPGYDLANVGPPMIYPDSADVRAQAAKLFK